MDILSESKSKKRVSFSTPKYNAVELHCTLSSISGSSNSSSRKKKFLLSKDTIYRKDDSTLSAERNQDDEKGSKEIIGDSMREEILVPDIRPDDLKPLFFRSKIFGSSIHKIANEFIIPQVLPIFGQSSSSTDDSLFTVGEHYFTYARKPFREVAVSPLKIDPLLNKQANLLWEDFIKDNPSINFCEKRKHINCFRTEPEYKFFKSKGKRLNESGNLNDCVLQKKKKFSIGSNICGMSTPSLTRPLGWMAILGIGIAERQKACNEDINSFDQHKSRLSKRKNYTSEENPSLISSQNESDEYPSPTPSKNESVEYPSPISIVNN